MPDKVQFSLVSPERLLMSSDVDMVVVPGTDGDFGVLPGHAPVISTIRMGVIEVHDGSHVERMFISSGVCEVSANRCTVLADEAAPVAGLERAELEQRLKDAEEDLTEAKADDEAYAAAEKIARLKGMLDALQ